jgi:hypothetical protein
MDMNILYINILDINILDVNILDVKTQDINILDIISGSHAWCGGTQLHMVRSKGRPLLRTAPS